MVEMKFADRTLNAFNTLARNKLKSRPLCISGMHRSGTSLTSSWFARCGLYVGDDLGPANESNPRGHFEDQDFVLFQGAAIGRIYPGSFGWQVTKSRFLRFDEVEEMRAREFVKERSKEHPFWGWKDPRSVLFLEHWREIAPETRFFLVWRNYVDVVESLMKRARVQKLELTQVSLAHALRIWIAYNNLVAEFKRRYPKDTVLVSSAAIQAKSEPVFNLLRNKLHVNLEYEPFSAVMDNKIWHEKKEPALPLKALAIIFGAGALEHRLAELSDIV